VHKEIDAVTPNDWAKCGEHCVKIQEEDYVKARLRDEILEPLILTKAAQVKMKTTVRTRLFQFRKTFFYVNIIIIVLNFIT